MTKMKTFVDRTYMPDGSYGEPYTYQAMASRDLTENVEQLQIVSALRLVQNRTIAALSRLARRVAETADLVPIVLFLASRYADYITGQTITVDGGASAI